MGIADLQRRMTEVGRIRLGQKTSSGRPSRLDTFRFTSADNVMIEEIAALYGGEAVPWTNDKKQQFEVITTTTTIPIYLPPQTVDPWYETWANGVCLRRCDGHRDLIHDSPCDCDADDRKCKPTTRVNVMLADVQGLGVWRLETHGIYAAGEMAQLSDLVAGIRIPLPARIMLERRGSKRFNREKNKVETLDYNVPVILIDAVTSRTVQLGQDAISQALQAGGHGAPVSAPPAIEASQARAIEGAKTPAPPRVDPGMIARALALIAAATPGEMPDMREKISRSDNPPELVAAYQARLNEHAAAQLYTDEYNDEMRQADAWTAPEPEQPSGPADVASSVPQPVGAASGDREGAMMRLMAAGGRRGLNRSQLDSQMTSDLGVGLKKATAEQLDALAVSL